MASRTLVIVLCLLAGGCQASFPEPRPVARGFQPETGVLAPYEDGKVHLAAGRYGLAIARFGQVLGTDRSSLDALNGLGIAYTQLGRFDIARAYFERALVIDPFSAPTLNNYGRALIEQGRLRDAGTFLQLALRHASQAQLTIVAANLESMRRTQPPALVTALRATPPTAASDRHRLIRLAANRYRLETPDLSSPPDPAALDAAVQRPAAEFRAPPRPALAEAHAGVRQGLAGRVGRSAIALSSAADLEALVRQRRPADPQATGTRNATLSGSWGSRAAAPLLTSGEPA